METLARYKILIIGKNSFIAKSFISVCEDDNIYYDTCRHNTIPKDLGEYNSIINFSINPQLYRQSYSYEIDQDALIARRISSYTNILYTMISSRAVYQCSNSNILFKEDIKLKKTSQSQYGLNKIESETICQNILGLENLTIIRPSNVFGLEEKRRTFMGIAQGSLLRNGEILLDVSKATIRDFIPVRKVSNYILKLITQKNTGVFNVGSGFGVSLERVCEKLIEGFGNGEIRVLDNAPVSDEFVLDTAKLLQKTQSQFDEKELLSCVKKIGQSLKLKKNK